MGQLIRNTEPYCYKIESPKDRASKEMNYKLTTNRQIAKSIIISGYFLSFLSLSR